MAANMSVQSESAVQPDSSVKAPDLKVVKAPDLKSSDLKSSEERTNPVPRRR
jgi:hypothetical protein